MAIVALPGRGAYTLASAVVRSLGGGGGGGRSPMRTAALSPSIAALDAVGAMSSQLWVGDAGDEWLQAECLRSRRD